MSFTQNDFLTKRFTSNAAYMSSKGIFNFVPVKNAKGRIKSIISNYPLIEIDKQGFCIDVGDRLQRVEFSECKLVEEDEE